MKGKTVVLKSKPLANDIAPMKILPTFNLAESDFPAIRNWRVGNKYKLEIEVENVGMNKDEWMEKQPLTTRLKILKITQEIEESDEFRAKKGHY